MTVGSIGLSQTGGKSRHGNAHYMHRTQIEGDTATNSKLSMYNSIEEVKKISSVNGIEPTLRNVDHIFRQACKTVKDGFQQKKFGWELPELL